VVDLPAMGLTMHAAEDLLAAIQAGRLRATPAVISAALECLDQVSRWVDHFEGSGSLPADAGDEARAVAARLRDLFSGATPGVAIRVQPEPFRPTAGTLPPWAARLIEKAGMRLKDRSSSLAMVAISYEPRLDCFFDGDDPLRLMRKLPELFALHIEAREPWRPLADLNPFACNLRLQAISAGSRASVSDLFRLVPDEVQIVDIPPEAVGSDDDIALVHAVLEEQRRLLRVSNRTHGFVGRVGAAARVAANALRYAKRADLAEQIEHSGAIPVAHGDAVALLVIIDEIVEALRTVSPAEEDAGRLADQRSATVERPADRFLRVDQAKVDALVNLAGELIVLKNRFTHLARRTDGDLRGEQFTREIRLTQDAIERISSEMHRATLQLRMIPMSYVFRSFPRLVRDMAQRLDKKVELVISGETTECDKAIVDRLFEPLLHLVRNAVDHGIETSERRRAALKPNAARVSMQATRLGDRLVVEVADDGRGIDPAIVKRKARERGLLAAEELDTLSDEQAIDLIFSAGLSTAHEVSDISGRGVGMDVVKTTIGQIGGRVSVTSRVGVGTTVRLDLPASIAISQIMIVEAGGEIFGIPMDTVTETIRLAPNRISQIKNNEGFSLRERTVPICSLAALLDLPEKQAPPGQNRLLVVTESEEKIIALQVDAIRDRLEVILKPMQGVLSQAEGYLGTTLLGDGRVLLVLDLRKILP